MSSFEEMPAEVRLRIYKQLFRGIRFVRVPNHLDYNSEYNIQRARKMIGLDIMLVSKQCYEDASEMWFNHAHLSLQASRFHGFGGSGSHLKTPFCLSEYNYARIRNCVFQYKCPSELGSRNRRQYFQHLKNLKTLEVALPDVFIVPQHVPSRKKNLDLAISLLFRWNIPTVNTFKFLLRLWNQARCSFKIILPGVFPRTGRGEKGEIVDLKGVVSIKAASRDGLRPESELLDVIVTIKLLPRECAEEVEQAWNKEQEICEPYTLTVREILAQQQLEVELKFGRSWCLPCWCLDGNSEGFDW